MKQMSKRPVDIVENSIRPTSETLRDTGFRRGRNCSKQIVDKVDNSVPEELVRNLYNVSRTHSY